MKRFKLICKNLNYKKSDLILSFLLLTLIFTITLLSCSFLTTTKKFISMNKNCNVNSRTLYVDSDIPLSEETFQKISTYDHIIAVFPKKARIYGTDLQLKINDNTYNTRVTFIGTNDKTIPDVIDGKKIDFNSNEILAPKTIKTNEGEKISGKNLIGNTVEIQIKKFDFSTSIPTVIAHHKKEFKVVGVYDNDKIITWENQFIASYKEVEAANTLTDGNLEQYSDKNITFMVTIDKYDNLQSVSSYLTSKGFLVSLVFRFNSWFISFIMSFILVITIVVFIVSVIILSSLQIRNINKRATDIGLMKALGYENKSILKVMLFHIEILSSLAFIPALAIACIVAHFLGPVLFFNVIPMSIFNKTIIITIMVVLLIPFLSIMFSLKKLLKISPVVAMKEVE